MEIGVGFDTVNEIIILVFINIDERTWLKLKLQMRIRVTQNRWKVEDMQA